MRQDPELVDQILSARSFVQSWRDIERGVPEDKLTAFGRDVVTGVYFWVEDWKRQRRPKG